MNIFNHENYYMTCITVRNIHVKSSETIFSFRPNKKKKVENEKMEKKITIVWIDKVSELSYHRKLFYQRLSSYEKRKLFVTRCHILRASERVIVTQGERMHETRDAFCEHCEPRTISVSAYSIQVVPVNLPLPPLSLPSPPQKRKIREGKLCV